MSERGKLNWVEAKARLADVQASLDRTETSDGEEAQRLFRDRAERLARPVERVDHLDLGRMLMVFALAGERYAIPVTQVAEVMKGAKVAPVPWAPAAVAGVMQVRGEIRPVYNLNQKLDLGVSHSNGSIVIVIRTGSQAAGIRVDAVEEVRAVRDEDRRLPGNGAHIAWMTEDLVGVLDVESLWEREG